MACSFECGAGSAVLGQRIHSCPVDMVHSEERVGCPSHSHQPVPRITIIIILGWRADIHVRWGWRADIYVMLGWRAA